MIEYTISTDEGPKTIKGHKISQYFAVHNDGLGEYVVTHIATGYAVDRFKRLRDAKAAVATFEPAWPAEALSENCPNKMRSFLYGDIAQLTNDACRSCGGRR